MCVQFLVSNYLLWQFSLKQWYLSLSIPLHIIDRHSIFKRFEYGWDYKPEVKELSHFWIEKTPETSNSPWKMNLWIGRGFSSTWSSSSILNVSMGSLILCQHYWSNTQKIRLHKNLTFLLPWRVKRRGNFTKALLKNNNNTHYQVTDVKHLKCWFVKNSLCTTANIYLT